MWLDVQQQRIKENIDRRIATVLKHGQYIMGPEVYELENKLSEYVGCRYALACSSGTDALILSLMAHGVSGPESLIFTTPFTFVSTAEAAAVLGARVLFIDIDPFTFNIDPIALKHQLEMLKPKSKMGIIGVDLFGLPADYEFINRIADLYNAFVIEDAAQSFGGELYGQKAGALADIGCTSFFPAKPLGCYGDGGMCFTDNEELFNIMKSLRIHGKGDNKYDNQRVGLNARLDTIQAAILLTKFEIFEQELEKRQQVALNYHRLLQECKPISIPTLQKGFKSAWAQYSIVFENRDERDIVSNKLKSQGIECSIYYPKPLHLQGAFRDSYYTTGSFPISERISETILSIPMHPYLTFEEQEKTVEVIYENVVG
jgi:UDP-2-acetamido-2-deoxy-ribo-hexuluronate aminotransferase